MESSWGGVRGKDPFWVCCSKQHISVCSDNKSPRLSPVWFELVRRGSQLLGCASKLIQLGISQLIWISLSFQDRGKVSLLALFDNLTAVVRLCEQAWQGPLCSLGAAHFPVRHQSLSLTDVPIVALPQALLCNLCSEGPVLLLWPLFPEVKAP